MQSGGDRIWGWLAWAQDRQCYVVATRWLKIIEIFNDLCVVEYKSQGETISRACPKRYLTSANEKLSLHFGLRKEGAMIGKFAQITSMWPLLSTSSSCMVGSSQASLLPTKLSLALLEMQWEEQQHTYTDLPFMSTVWNLTTLATEFLTFGTSTFISPII